VTEPEPLQQVDRTYVLYRDRRLSYFAGCDYYRFASHPAVIRAARESIGSDGLNVAASRLTTGNHAVYHELEQALGEFFCSETALLVPTGYLTNLAVAQTLSGMFTHVFIDDAAHPSLQ
jgi:7-keto-8-aminopelargonate synthetase-like enzyme